MFDVEQSRNSSKVAYDEQAWKDSCFNILPVGCGEKRNNLTNTTNSIMIVRSVEQLMYTPKHEAGDRNQYMILANVWHYDPLWTNIILSMVLIGTIRFFSLYLEAKQEHTNECLNERIGF